MTTTPPVPAANQSPYPVQQPAHPHTDHQPGTPVARTPAREDGSAVRAPAGSRSLIVIAALAVAGAVAGVAAVAARAGGNGRSKTAKRKK